MVAVEVTASETLDVRLVENGLCSRPGHFERIGRGVRQTLVVVDVLMEYWSMVDDVVV